MDAALSAEETGLFQGKEKLYRQTPLLQGNLKKGLAT